MVASQTIDRRLLQRRCVACGYDGALLRGGHAARCARCGCDLGVRPARSYADMEGLLGHTTNLDGAMMTPDREERLVHRWLAFFFFSVVLIILLGYLTASAFAV